MSTKICKLCGTVFEPQSNRQQYCSRSCSKEMEKSNSKRAKKELQVKRSYAKRRETGAFSIVEMELARMQHNQKYPNDRYASYGAYVRACEMGLANPEEDFEE